MVYIRKGTRWRRFQELPSKRGPGAVHVQWWFENERRWLFFCSNTVRHRGKPIADTQPITCGRCGSTYGDD